MQYKVLEQLTAIGLEFAVKEYIEKGWVPLGGVSGSKNGTGMYCFTQAMVKYEEPDKEEQEFG